MKSETSYYISIEEIKEILSAHIDKITENSVYVNPEDICFDIRYADNGCSVVAGAEFVVDEEITL